MKQLDQTKLKVALTELLRERKVREFYYPKAISEGKLTRAEAQRRLEALNFAIEILTTLVQSVEEEVVTDGAHPNLLQ